MPDPSSSPSRKRRIDLGDDNDNLQTNGDSYYEADASSKAKRSKVLNPWTGLPYTNRYYSILETRQKLPVYQFKDDLIEAVKKNQFVVVEGETGSGAYLKCCCFC